MTLTTINSWIPRTAPSLVKAVGNDQTIVYCKQKVKMKYDQDQNEQIDHLPCST